MAVVICPGSVRAQIDEKDRRLDELNKVVGDAYCKIESFCNAGAGNAKWDGKAFVAACAHMEAYRNFCKALGECIEKTRLADQKVKEALGNRFGDASYINEQEWLDAKGYAEDRVKTLRDQAAYAERENNDSWGFAAGFGAAVLRYLADGWQRQADFADEMLSKIHSYRQETDHLYEGLSDWLGKTRVDAAVISNCSALFSRDSLWQKDMGSFLWSNTSGAALVKGNESLLLGKGYGYDFDVVLIADPVIRPIADWLSENENYAKIAFGLGDIVLGAVSGEPLVIVVGGVSVAEGISGCIQGETVDWGADASRDLATVLGGDPDKAELTYLGITGGISAKGVGKAAKVVAVEEDASSFSRAAKTSKALSGGMRDVELESSASDPMFSIGSQLKDFEAFAGAFDRIEDTVDVIGKVQDASKLIDEKREDGYAEAPFAAVRYGY